MSVISIEMLRLIDEQTLRIVSAVGLLYRPGLESFLEYRQKPPHLD